MRKCKNITLLVGITCVFTAVVWQVIKAVFHYFSILNEDGFNYFIAHNVLPVAIILLLMPFPVILLIRNLKNKTGKALPIISITINCVVLLWLLFFSLTPAIPQYLIISELGRINTYFTVIMHFLESGGLLLVVGYVALIIGGFLSLPKKKGKNTINDKDTAVTDN